MLCVVNLVVCPYCDRHLRIKQEIQDAKLKCRFCAAIFVGSAQSAESVPVNYGQKSQKRPKRLNPMRYARIRCTDSENDSQNTEATEILETPNPEITKRGDVAVPQHDRPLIAALGAETEVCPISPSETNDNPKPFEEIVVEKIKQADAAQENGATHSQPAKEQTVDKPEPEPQHAVKQELAPNDPSDIPEPMNNKQFTHKPQIAKTEIAEEPIVEIPVVVTQDEAAGHFAPTMSKTKLKLKWIIASAIFALIVVAVGLVIINL
jgi:hypothetical protein